MTYPFVAAYHDYGPALGPRLGITWHMAQGGGTVSYLAKPNPNGVAVHFVIERDGDIIQMLRLDHANGSIRPTAIRTTNDKPYFWAGVPVTYGAATAKAVLGSWWSDPNSATIGVECEGFAADGPNAAQTTSMDWLWRDLAERFPGIRSLAHRDFADYKSCPGRLVPWDRVGGHGPEADMSPLRITNATLADVDLTVGDQLHNPDGSPLVKVSVASTKRSPYGVTIGTTGYRVVPVSTGGETVMALVPVAAVTIRPVTDASPYTEADLDAAIAADRARARVTWE